MPRHHEHVIHESHKVEAYWNDYADYHNDQWRCTVCQETACVHCALTYDDALVEPCTGFDWRDGITIKVNSKDTRVRRSGLGWPE